MRAPRPARGAESMSATVLWIMLALNPAPRPVPWDESTPMEQRISRHYALGMLPNRDACRRAYGTKIGATL